MMLLKTQAATEVAQFLAYHPTPEQIVAFRPSPAVAERAYELINIRALDTPVIQTWGGKSPSFLWGG